MYHREMAREVNYPTLLALTAAVWNSQEFEERAEQFLAGEQPDSRPFTGVRPESDSE
jgi:hypothetical protein